MSQFTAQLNADVDGQKTTAEYSSGNWTTPVYIRTELPAGTQLIGSVKISDDTNHLLINSDGTLNIVNMNSGGAEIFTALNPGLVTISGSLPTGSNNIGKVDINTIPALSAGSNLIGKVDINSSPLLMTKITDGTNTLSINSDGTIKAVTSQDVLTHDAVLIGASTEAVATNWMDCSPYDNMEVTFQSTTANVSIDIYWSHDGTSLQIREKDIIATSSTNTTGYTSSAVRVKAPYAKLVVVNQNAASVTASCWAYLKP